MAPYQGRANFFQHHIGGCEKCRKEWELLASELPQSKRNKALEQVVEANHSKDKSIA